MDRAQRAKLHGNITMPRITVELIDDDQQPFDVEVSYAASHVTDPLGTGDSPAEWDIQINWVRLDGVAYTTMSSDEELIEEEIINDLR